MTDIDRMIEEDLDRWAKNGLPAPQPLPVEGQRPRGCPVEHRGRETGNYLVRCRHGWEQAACAKHLGDLVQRMIAHDGRDGVTVWSI